MNLFFSSTVYAGLSGLVTFPYQNFWFIWVYAFFFFFCTFGINMLIFFEDMQVLCTVGSQNHAFLASLQVLWLSQNLQRVCNVEVNKAQIKNGFRFWFSYYFILLKNTHHQNKTNRMCIKHRKLQCFLSMSLNLFSTTLGYVIFLPPSKGGPGGGGLPFVSLQICTTFKPRFFRRYKLGKKVGEGAFGQVRLTTRRGIFTPPQRIAQKNHPACENFGSSFLLWNCCIIICSTVVNKWMVIWWKMCIFFWLPDQNGLWGNVCREDHGCGFLFRCVLALERSSSDHINCNPTRGKQQFIDNFVTSKWYFTQSQVNLPPLLRYWPPRQKVVVIKGSLTLMRPC